MARMRGLDRDQATMVERQVPAYNRLKTDCVARRSVWLRTRTAGGVRAGGLSAPGYSISDFFYPEPFFQPKELQYLEGQILDLSLIIS